MAIILESVFEVIGYDLVWTSGVISPESLCRDSRVDFRKGLIGEGHYTRSNVAV
jgi:hypothetical protein